MARTKRTKTGASGKISVRDTKNESTALAVKSKTPDSFEAAIEEMNTLYQKVKDGDKQALVNLRALNTMIRLQFAVLDFKDKMTNPGKS